MTKISYSCSLLLLLVSIPAQTQNLDSLERALADAEGGDRILLLNALAFEYGHVDPRKAANYGLQAYELVRDQPVDSVGAAARQWLGAAYRGLGMLDSAVFFMTQALEMNQQLGEERATAINHYNLSTVYIDQLNNEEALEHLLAACRYFEENEPRTYLNLVPALGTIYRNMGQEAEARKVMEEGLANARKMEERDPISEAFLLGNLAKIVSTAPFTEDELGIKYDREAVSIFREYGLLNPLRATLNDLAALHVEVGQYDSVPSLYQESLQLAEQLGIDEGKLYAHAGLGTAYLKQKDYANARIHFEQAIAYEGKVEDQAAFFDLYDYFSEVEKASGNDQQAYELLRKAFELQDTIYRRESLEQLNELQVKYDTEKRERELAEQKLLTLQEQTRNRNLQIGFGLGLMVLVLGGAFLFVRNRFQQRLKVQRLMAEQQKKRFAAVIEAEEAARTRIARDLHDGLGQLLSTARMNVSSLDEAVESGGDTEDNAVLGTSIRLLDEAATEVRQVSHNLMPLALRDKGWIVALRHMAEGVNAVQHGPRLEIDSPSYIGRLPEEKEIALYRICQEILNNSLRHAEAGHMQLHIQEKGHGIEVVFTDDGKGLRQQDIEASQGIGWRNILTRTDLMGGTFTLEKPEKGTRIRLFFP